MEASKKKPRLFFVFCASVILITLCASPALADNSLGNRSRFGFSMGNPGGINLVLVRPIQNRIGFKLSGGYLKTIWGVQGNLYLNARRSYPVWHDVALIAGSFDYDTKSDYEGRWTYGGVAYDFHWRKFFAEAGLQFGSGDCDCDAYLSLEVGLLFPNVKK